MQKAPGLSLSLPCACQAGGLTAALVRNKRKTCFLQPQVRFQLCIGRQERRVTRHGEMRHSETRAGLQSQLWPWCRGSCTPSSAHPLHIPQSLPSALIRHRVGFSTTLTGF